MGLTFPGTGAQLDLLWQNSNPKAEFAAQSIELDLSSYTAVLIRYSDTTMQNGAIQSTVAFVDNTRNIIMQYAESGNYVLGRTARMDEAAAHFGDCAGPYGVNNAVAVPYQIYGLQF